MAPACTEWLPTSDYEQAVAPQPERCTGRTGVESGEVWIPVRKRVWRGQRHTFRSSFDKTGIYWTIFE